MSPANAARGSCVFFQGQKDADVRGHGYDSPNSARPSLLLYVITLGQNKGFLFSNGNFLHSARAATFGIPRPE